MKEKTIQNLTRIAKFIAHAGVCSRRDAEKLILEGRVSVNGKKITSPALNVSEDDRIVVNNKVLEKPERMRLWRYHKPNGVITTHKDPENRPTLFDELPQDMPRVISVGRLDLTTEGLILLTNNGDLARALELPSTGWVRRYRVRVYGQVDDESLQSLEEGITIEGVHYAPIEATIDTQKGAITWITMSLKEGKNREIRKIIEHFGWQVTRLIRISYGPFQLGSLEKGSVEEVKPKVLKEQLGTLVKI
jgi:23S rRNA pseudouridine2605 synthase